MAEFDVAVFAITTAAFALNVFVVEVNDKFDVLLR